MDTNCCGEKRVSTPPPLRVNCPECLSQGRTVNNITVKSLVLESFSTDIGDDDYNICLTEDCDVVYYNGFGQLFRQAEVSVPVWFKATTAPDYRLACYCYQLTTEDIIAEMRRNPKARSFGEVQTIFQMKACRCEKKHPFGGNCACASAVGKAVKLGRKDPEVIKVDKMRESIPKVYIVENIEDCCGPSPGKPLADFLERKFGDDIEVRIFNVAQGMQSVPLSLSLVDAMERDGKDALPALIVDGQVMASGSLPNFLDAVGIIKKAGAAQ